MLRCLYLKPALAKIFDIIDDITSRISDVDVLFKLREETTQTIGANVEEVAKMYFDENASVDSLQFFDYASIPAIRLADVPTGVSSVHFRSDLTEVSPIEHFDNDSVLFNSL